MRWWIAKRCNFIEVRARLPFAFGFHDAIIRLKSLDRPYSVRLVRISIIIVKLPVFALLIISHYSCTLYIFHPLFLHRFSFRAIFCSAAASHWNWYRPFVSSCASIVCFAIFRPFKFASSSLIFSFSFQLVFCSSFFAHTLHLLCYFATSCRCVFLHFRNKSPCNA